VDARIDFDLRTAFDDSLGPETTPQHEPQWLVAVFEALSQKRSNLQMAVGARFDYNLCSLTQSPAIAQRLAECWVAYKPIIDKMLSAGLYIHNRPA
jgi:site-specific recombinase